MNNISMWGDNYEDLFGVCLFNFAVVVAIPAWLYEKKPSVSVTTGEFHISTLLNIDVICMIAHIFFSF